MILHTTFIQNEQRRNVLYTHFKHQLDKVARSANCSIAENELREFCKRKTLDAAQMNGLWQMWCEMAKFEGAPLKPLVDTYISLLDVDKNLYNWGGMNDEAIKQKLTEAMPAVPTAAAEQQSTESSPLRARISFLAHPYNLSRQNSQSMAEINKIRPVHNHPEISAQRANRNANRTEKTEEVEEKASTAATPASSTRLNPSSDSPTLSHSQASYNRNHSPSTPRTVSSAAVSPSASSSCSSSSSNLLPSHSSSSSSSTPPPNNSSRAAQSSTSPMTLPLSASQSWATPAPTMAALPSNASVNDRLMSHWPIHVLQNSAEISGFAIKSRGIVERDASLTVSTNNESSVEVERKPNAAEVAVTIPSQIAIDSNARLAMAARMATVVFFSNMPLEAIATLEINRLTIESNNPEFKAALKSAMTNYIAHMQRSQPSPQQNSSARLAANLRYDVPQNQANHQYQRAGI